MTDEHAMTSERIPTASRKKKANQFLAVLLVLVIVMFGFAYANAEFFVMICQKAGILSAPPEQADAALAGQKAGRPLEVYFSANVNDGLPIAFTVDQRYQKTNLGVTTTNDYRFTNLSDRTIYFRPIHDVNPTQAGKPDVMLLTKCFCFDMQKIEPQQTYTLPVEYTYTDKLNEKTRVIRMNYSLFPSTKEAYEEWQAQAEQGVKLSPTGEDFLKEALPQ